MSDSYTHRLDPRTDANLTAAILAVGNLLGVSPIADSVIEHLKDRIGDSLSPAQRGDPFSVYSAGLLGLMTEYVKETYGIDRPANIHAAPVGPQGREQPIGSDSVFALDGLGRNRFEILTGGTSGSYARMVADITMSSAAYSAMTVWNPSSGAAGLNEFNFGGTPFAQNGLDLATTKYLLGQGFNQTQIVAAAQDTKALGFSPKDKEAIRDHAIIRARDPEADETNRRLQGLQGTLATNPEYQALAEQWRATTDPVERARLGKLMLPFEEEAKVESGVQERLDDPSYDPQARGAVERRSGAIIQKGREHTEAVQKLGAESYLASGDAAVAPVVVPSELGSTQPSGSNSVDDFAADLPADVGGTPSGSTTAATPSQGAAGSTSTVGADAAPQHPGKEEDDQVPAEPKKPAVDVAAIPLRPPAPGG